MNRVYKKKKKKRTFFPLRLIFVLVIITVCVYFGYKYRDQLNQKINGVIQTIAQINYTKAKIPEQDYSSENNISNIEGQTLVENQDGYTTTFTTLNTKHQKTYKEFKQNGDASWSEKSYWGGTMSENGCGITSMAIVASGYGIDETPETLRQKYYPHLDSENMKNAFKKMGFKSTDFYFHESYLSKKYIVDWLKTNRPIIICVGNEKKNKWTTASHYMALLDVNDKGLVYLSNPNGEEEDNTESRMV